MQNNRPNIAIRTAVESDVNRIMEMIRGMAKYEKLTHQLEIDESALRSSLFSDNPVPHALVAEIDDRVVGYAIYFFNFSTFLGKNGLYLEDLYVDTEHRGKGVGDLLFRSVANIAHTENCGRMEWVALDWNTPALEFYKAKGAQNLDEWRLHRLSRKELTDLVGD